MVNTLEKSKIKNDLPKYYKHLFETVNNNDLQSRHTPYSILKKMCTSIKIKSTDSILIFYNTEIATFLVSEMNVKQSQITIYNNSKLKSQLLKSAGYNVIYQESFDRNNIITNMKFDVELFNPPYNQGLFVEFLNKGFSLLNDGGVMCAIHPSTFIINKKETNKGKKHEKFNRTIEKYKSSINLIDGNLVFNAGFFTPLSITTIYKTEDTNIDVIYDHMGVTKHTTVKSVSDIWMHGDDLAISIFNKIRSKMETSIDDHLSRKGARSKYYLNINKVAGHKPKPGVIGNNPDFNCMLYKTHVDSGKYTDRLSSDFKEGDFNYVAISSKKHAKNLHDYITTKFARFALSLYKINVQLSRGELKIVPYLDFNESWDDQKCFDYFELTQEEINFINTYIQDYYEHDFK